MILNDRKTLPLNLLISVQKHRTNVLQIQLDNFQGLLHLGEIPIRNLLFTITIEEISQCLKNPLHMLEHLKKDGEFLLGKFFEFTLGALKLQQKIT